MPMAAEGAFLKEADLPELFQAERFSEVFENDWSAENRTS